MARTVVFSKTLGISVPTAVASSNRSEDGPIFDLGPEEGEIRCVVEDSSTLGLDGLRTRVGGNLGGQPTRLGTSGMLPYVEVAMRSIGGAGCGMEPRSAVNVINRVSSPKNLNIGEMRNGVINIEDKVFELLCKEWEFSVRAKSSAKMGYYLFGDMLQTWDLGSFRVSRIGDDKTEFLVILNDEIAYNKVLSKSFVKFRGFTISLQAYDPLMKVYEDSSLVPVWVRLPNYPPHLYNDELFECIGNGLGRLLKIDPDTSKKLKLEAAFLYVLVDLRKPLLDEVKVKSNLGNVDQIVHYIGLPLFCSNCHLLGHSVTSCDVLMPYHGNKVWQVKQAVHHNKLFEEMPQGYNELSGGDVFGMLKDDVAVLVASPTLNGSPSFSGVGIDREQPVAACGIASKDDDLSAAAAGSVKSNRGDSFSMPADDIATLLVAGHLDGNAGNSTAETDLHGACENVSQTYDHSVWHEDRIGKSGEVFVKMSAIGSAHEVGSGDLTKLRDVNGFTADGVHFMCSDNDEEASLQELSRGNDERNVMVTGGTVAALCIGKMFDGLPLSAAAENADHFDLPEVLADAITEDRALKAKDNNASLEVECTGALFDYLSEAGYNSQDLEFFASKSISSLRIDIPLKEEEEAEEDPVSLVTKGAAPSTLNLLNDGYEGLNTDCDEIIICDQIEDNVNLAVELEGQSESGNQVSGFSSPVGDVKMKDDGFNTTVLVSAGGSKGSKGKSAAPMTINNLRKIFNEAQGVAANSSDPEYGHQNNSPLRRSLRRPRVPKSQIIASCEDENSEEDERIEAADCRDASGRFIKKLFTFDEVQSMKQTEYFYKIGKGDYRRVSECTLDCGLRKKYFRDRGGRFREVKTRARDLFKHVA